MRDGQKSHLNHEPETLIGVMATLIIATLSGFAGANRPTGRDESPLRAASGPP